ncbi:MAG: hypothetical protein PHH37_04145 [Paludibacter sp.]|nr:hypothetical protein [Paludibacter sp.]
MNSLYKIRTAIIALFVILLPACTSYDFELTKSVFIEDSDYPGLPIYSEWGYNTFGMYVDRTAFVSSEDVFPVKIIVNPDTFKLNLNGMLDNDYATLQIYIVGYAPLDYPDLIDLNDSVIDLTSSDCIVKLKKYNTTSTLKIIKGNLTFKKVQNLYVDKEFTKTILSGKIEFKTFFDDEPVAITNGRFDLSVGYENFYYY